MKGVIEKVYLREEILAGIYIALAAFANCCAIAQGQPLIGALLFPVGLLIICEMKYKLFTGMVRWLPVYKDYKYLTNLVVALIGNVVGVMLIALLTQMIAPAAQEIASVLAEMHWLTALTQGILCGLCITAACQAYKNRESHIITYLMVVVFVFCGMRHCIADAYYLTVSNMWAAAMPQWCCVVIGNFIGGMIPNL